MTIIDDFRLNSTTALVTGAGRGIGAAVSQALAEAGAVVVCLDLDYGRAQATVESLETEGLAIAADVSDPHALENAFEHATSKVGNITAVFANAGISGDLLPFYETDVDDWQRVINVNLTGVFLTARLAARHMIDNDIKGTITSTASIYGFVGSLNGTSPAYTAAKAGVRNLTKDMAVSAAKHGIRVNAIAPGFVATELLQESLDRLDPQDKEEYLANVRATTPIGHMAASEDLKGVAVFLASEASRHITGVTIPVDGGFLSR